MMEDQAEVLPGIPVRPAERRNADVLIDLALEEDLGQVGDITSRPRSPGPRGTARFVARAPGVLAGMPVVARLVERFELCRLLAAAPDDGDRLERGTVIAEIAGPARSILTLERTALNFLQRLSGIATLTARFVAAVQGTSADDPRTRARPRRAGAILEKYAVRCGGGRNHRLGLHDAVLIKDNHLAWLHAQGGQRADRRGHRGGAGPCPCGGNRRGRGRFAGAARSRPAAAPTSSWSTTSGPEALAEAVRLRDRRRRGSSWRPPAG